MVVEASLVLINTSRLGDFPEHAGTCSFKYQGVTDDINKTLHDVLACAHKDRSVRWRQETAAMHGEDSALQCCAVT